MARSRRGGGGGGLGSRRAAPSRSAPSRTSAPPARSASTSTTPAPMPQQQQSGGMLSGIGSTIAQGMAFGTGSAMAHQAVGAVAGSFGGGGSAREAAPADQQAYDAGAQNQQQQLQGACGQDKQMFYECLQINKGDQQACSFLYDQLQQCQRNENQMSFN